MSISVEAEAPIEERKLISRTSMLILGGFLIGITYAHALNEGLKSYVFLAGAFGLVAYIGLNYIAHLHKKRSTQRAVSRRLAKLERRFDQHLGSDGQHVEATAENDTEQEAATR